MGCSKGKNYFQYDYADFQKTSLTETIFDKQMLEKVKIHKLNVFQNVGFLQKITIYMNDGGESFCVSDGFDNKCVP